MIKKCFLFNCLCPVYGVAALLIIYSTKSIKSKPVTFLIGSLVSSATELIFGIIYYNLLDVRIWNYSDMYFNLYGHVNLVYSLFWGVLSLILVYKLHPIVKNIVSEVKIPKSVFICIIIIFIIDVFFSSFFMKKYKTAKALSLSWLINH